MPFSHTVVDLWAGLGMQLLDTRLQETTLKTTCSMVTVLGLLLALIQLQTIVGPMSSINSVGDTDVLFEW